MPAPSSEGAPGPLLDFDEVAVALSDLQTLNFFPAGAGGLAVCKLFASICWNMDQVHWLVGRLVLLYNKWPGPAEVRAVFCKRYPPRDGFDVRDVYVSEIYPDGIPCETPESFLSLPAVPGRPALPPGSPGPDLRPWPEDELAVAREELTKLMDRKRAERKRPALAAPAPPGLALDVERAAADLKRWRTVRHEFEPAAEGVRCRLCWLPVGDALHGAG